MIEILRLSLPITLWLTGFSAVYGLQGLSCSRHWPTEFDTRPILIAAWGIAILVQMLSLFAVLYARSTSNFVQTTAVMLAALALIATVFTLMPVLVTSSCF